MKFFVFLVLVLAVLALLYLAGVLSPALGGFDHVNPLPADGVRMFLAVLGF